MSVRNQLLPGVIGGSPAMREVDRVTRKVAVSNASVLILGETGTGKELVASAIHQLSHRSGGPFVKVNCGALSESLLESELFGHVRGSFTGAIANRAGRFEAADGGSIFLDEINSTTMTLQVKLLRVLQEKEFERVGDTTTHHTDARVIAASNRDLMRQVHNDRFREDLYWRLNVVPIEIPALRHRREDIPALVSFFLDYYNDINDRYVTHISPEVMLALQEYHWPGNVRELQNYVERAVVMSDTDELTLDLLPSCVLSGEPLVNEFGGSFAGSDEGASLAGGHPGGMGSPGAISPGPMSPGAMSSGDSLGAGGAMGGGGVRGSDPGLAAVSPAAYVDRMDVKTLTRFVVSRGLAEADEEENVHASVVDQIEKELIAQVLAQCGGVQTKAAARLGMNRNTLYKKIKQYELG
ncbi:two component, sigma54 specific, Fis family transcriptional regulator [Rhodopirellula sp. SWK7]|nr:sigma-54 dependent transcriptional regulator [Rhodopirellula sp. SWK7]EMI42295.1 two component, sigma54 specific, Fis family transcriptional regulator [Rhodopirellula sp. SWK7]